MEAQRVDLYKRWVRKEVSDEEVPLTMFQAQLMVDGLHERDVSKGLHGGQRQEDPVVVVRPS